jgi:flagellar biosynthesis component FlhA
METDRIQAMINRIEKNIEPRVEENVLTDTMSVYDIVKVLRSMLREYELEHLKELL